MKDTQNRLSHLTISLHWLIALTIIGLLATGIYMEENKAYALYPIHKSIGIIIFVFVMIRVVWRVINGWPEPASTYKKIEQITAKIVHWILIVGTVLMPVSGMMMSGGGGHGLDIFGLEILAVNFDPNNPKEIIALNETVGEIGHKLHGLCGNIMIAAILLHIAGAFKHHFMDKDGTLRRMLGFKI